MQPTQTHQRFIIERPRLIELLDSFESRIVLITAPAGYGKSTLARQWAAKRENVLWYEATPASRDVAALAMGLARACGLSADEQSKLRARIDALANPDDHASSLQQVLCRSLAERYGSRSPTLVIDETDVVLTAPSSTLFLQELLESAPLRFIVIGRQRPRWVSTRKLLYAEIAEIDRDRLAFTEPEAAQLLSALPGASTRAMWSRTKGWPAVLRLAVLTQNASLPDEPIGLSLHEYFAEELFEIASAELRAQLPCLALLPTLKSAVLQLVLGDDHQKLEAEAVEIGFLSPSGVNEFDMHPLLRSFLAVKFEPATSLRDSKELLLRLLDLREWDNAFSLIAKAQLYEYLPQLVARSLDILLSEGRLTTLEDWVALGLAQNIDSPDIYLLEAELSRRAGAFSTASTQALKAAEAYRAAGHPWASRSFSIAGICAHLSRYSPDASEHYAKARAAAQSNEDARQAIWGQLLTSYTQEDETTETLLDEFERHVGADPAARLRLATGRFIVACSRGRLENTVREHLEPFVGLADSVHDPLIKSSFFYQISFGFILTGYYKAALDLVGRGEDEVRMQRLFFAETHLAAARIAATIGLRRFKKAQSLVDRLADLATAVDDSFEFANSRALQARLLICMGDDEHAAAALREWESTPVTALTAELAGLRALALTSSRIDEAEQLARLAIQMSGNAQAQTVAYAAQAIIDLRTGLEPAESRLEAFEDVLLDRQNYDALVLAYRSYPPILSAVGDRGRIPQRRLLRLIGEAQDAQIAASVGMGLPDASKSGSSLSSREQEVFDLMRRGRKNKEIAATLFISEATVKVHVRHILEKLNVRSRTEAVARYQDT